MKKKPKPPTSVKPMKCSAELEPAYDGRTGEVIDWSVTVRYQGRTLLYPVHMAAGLHKALSTVFPLKK